MEGGGWEGGRHHQPEVIVVLRATLREKGTNHFTGIVPCVGDVERDQTGDEGHNEDLGKKGRDR